MQIVVDNPTTLLEQHRPGRPGIPQQSSAQVPVYPGGPSQTLQWMREKAHADSRSGVQGRWLDHHLPQ
eukprot:12718689-Ditylum_brightwellii.AAC.1